MRTKLTFCLKNSDRDFSGGVFTNFKVIQYRWCEFKEIRKAFLDFFSAKEQQIVSSAPMVVKNDPT
jgi:ribosomal protein S2